MRLVAMYRPVFPKPTRSSSVYHATRWFAGWVPRAACRGYVVQCSACGKNQQITASLSPHGGAQVLTLRASINSVFVGRGPRKTPPQAQHLDSVLQDTRLISLEPHATRRHHRPGNNNSGGSYTTTVVVLLCSYWHYGNASGEHVRAHISC